MTIKKIFLFVISLVFFGSPLHAFARKHVYDKKPVALLYKNCGFRGKRIKAHLGSHKQSFRRFGLSSFKLPKGFGLIIYQKRNFKGGHKFFRRSVKCLKAFKVNTTESLSGNPHISHRRHRQGTLDNRAASYRVIAIRNYNKYH